MFSTNHRMSTHKRGVRTIESLESRAMFSTTPYLIDIDRLLDSENDSVHALHMADLDADGDSDLIEESATGISWAQNNDSVSQFERKPSISGEATAGFLALDMDNDSDIDILTLHASSGIQLHENVDGVFSEPRTLVEIPEMGSTILAHDFDSDDDIDLIVTHLSNRFSVFEQLADQDFQLKQTVKTPGNSEPHLAAMDADSDGDLDVASASQGVYWFKNESGRFTDLTSHHQMIQANDASKVTVFDIDRDGHSDIIVQRPNAVSEGKEFAVFTNPHGTGNFQHSAFVAGPNQVSSTSELAIGDFDRDGVPDIFALMIEDGQTNGQLFWSRNNTRSFGKWEPIAENVSSFHVDAVRRDTDVVAIDTNGHVFRISHRVIGDANNDGRFDSQDFVQVFQVGEYSDNVVANSTFAEGDWNGDNEFDSGDLVFAFQNGVFHQAIEYPRLFFGPSELPAIKSKIDTQFSAEFVREKKRAMALLSKDYSDPNLQEQVKAQDAARIAFVVLMLDAEDPDRTSLAEKTREILRNINEGQWEGYGHVARHNASWNGTEDLHPWYAGGAIMDYSLTYDWMMGAGELTGVDQQDARFRILKLAQIEHSVHTTPFDELNRSEFSIRQSNYAFRSFGGVGIAALTFPDQVGAIYDPFDRVAPEYDSEFNSAEVLDRVISELFEEITFDSKANPTDQGLIDYYVSPDGFYGEGFTYQNDAFEVMAPFLVSYHRLTGIDYISDDGVYDGRIAKMFTNDIRVSLPNGDRPLIGDAWNGWGYYWHEIIAPYTEDPAPFYWFAAKRIWLVDFGVTVPALPENLNDIPEPDYRTEFMPDTGIAVFRDKWGEDGTHLMLMAQHLPVFGHDQADQGSISLYANGAHLIVDPGYGRAYARESGPGGRLHGGKWNWMKSALGHSGITVDSIYSVDNTPSKPLTRVVHPRIQPALYESDDYDPAFLENTLAARDIDHAEARVVYNAVDAELRRGVSFPRHRYFILEDRLTAQADHDYGWQLQLGETATSSFSETEDGYLWQTPNDEGEMVGLGITFLDGNRKVNVYENGPTNYSGTHYPDSVYDRTYMLAEEKAQDTKYVTILDPHANSDSPLQIETLVDGKAWKVIHSGTAYDIIVSQDTSQPITVGQIATDAKFVVASIDHVHGNDVVRSIFAKGGSELSIGYNQNQTFDLNENDQFHLEIPLDGDQ